jgi:hypothetical protein
MSMLVIVVVISVLDVPFLVAFPYRGEVAVAVVGVRCCNASSFVVALNQLPV